MPSSLPSRRRFLQTSSALAVAAATPGVLIARDARAAIPTTLVSIHLTGGNDTLNTIIHHADPEYYRVRGPLAISKSDMIQLDERHGLHPALKGFYDLFKRNKVAVVHGVGYPDFNYSHFEASKIYATGDPSRTLTTGWLGRALDSIFSAGQADVLTGAAIGGGQPSVSAASFLTPALPSNPDDYSIPASNSRQLEALNSIITQPVATGRAAFNTVARGGRSAWESLAIVSEASRRTTSVAYPDSGFGTELRFVAQLLHADPSVRVIGMTQGSYDTHDNQRARQNGQLQELNAGITAFMSDLAARGLSGRVIVLLWSEFSRRIARNGTGGTDHGSAQALIMLGDSLRSGFLNDPPTLTDPDHVDGRNLRMRVDFRQVYSTLLSGWLELDSKKLLGNVFSPLSLLL
jgi:uncharacterized protein (DUF1501 family)